MTRHFQKEIEKIKKRILHLTAMVEESLSDAVKSFTDRDVRLAEKVIDGDTKIDQMEVEVEEECLKILALHQPVAIDLRFLIAVLKINNDLERIGDLAVNIAQRTQALAQSSMKAVPFDLSSMLHVTLGMVKKSADALVDLDTNAAYEVCQSDDEVDEYHRSAYTAVQQEIQKNPAAAEYFICLLSISRNLERIADHATNIAEDVIYMVDGQIIRHKGGPAATQES
jgi:phosphate transport system protein